jgi:hypothetical protein
MAKYSEYVEKVQKDALEAEIDHAAAEHASRQDAEPDNSFAMPERFKDKSPEEIARSYVELEKTFSRQGQTIGELRKAVDQFWDLKSQRETEKETPQEAPITVDDLYENPDEAVGRAAEKRVSGRIEALERELAQARIQSRVDSLGEKFPGWQDETKTPEFQNWISESPYRARLAAAADAYDMDAAEEVLGLYYEVRGVRSAEADQRRNRQLDQASLEAGGGPHQPKSAAKFSRAELMQKRVAAMHGDQEADMWLRANREEIAIAYEEGRVID